MRTLIETFVTVFLASITVLICAEFIGIQLQTNNAKDLHTTYVSMIESSDFDTATIDQCKTDAQDKGYELEVDNSSMPKKNYPFEISPPSERCCWVLLKPRKPLKIRQFIHAKAL